MAGSNEKAAPSVEDDSLQSEQDYSVESDPLTTPQSTQPKESPVILENYVDKSPQEGIKDAFSKDQGDRFQSKVESRPLAEGQPPNEKTSNVKSDKEELEVKK